MKGFKSHLKKALPTMVLILVLVLLIGCSSSSSNVSSSDNNQSNSSSNNNRNDSENKGDDQPLEEIVTIKFANFSGSGDEPAKALEKMRQTFEELNPNIKVDIETVGFGDYFTQMQTRIVGGTAPDAFELNYENFVAYMKLGVLEDLGPYFEKNNFDTSAIYEQALQAFSDDGKQFGMPASFSNVVLIYNKNLFDQAGADYPTKDWTWKEMNEAAVKIRALGDNIFGIHQGVHFHEFYKAVQQNGGSLFNKDGTEFTINTPENIETLKHMADRINVTNVMASEAQLSGIGDWELFKDGRLGMILTGVWAFPDFTANIVDFEWDIEVEPGNIQKATHFFTNGLVVNKDSKQKDAAYKWVEFMSASREAAEIRIEANWELPAVTDPDVLDAYLQITPPANRQAVYDSLEYLVTPPVIAQFSEMDDILTRHLDTAAQGAVSPEQALEAAQQELQDKIRFD